MHRRDWNFVFRHGADGMDHPLDLTVAVGAESHAGGHVARHDGILDNRRNKNDYFFVGQILPQVFQPDFSRQPVVKMIVN